MSKSIPFLLVFVLTTQDSGIDILEASYSGSWSPRLFTDVHCPNLIAIFPVGDESDRNLELISEWRKSALAPPIDQINQMRACLPKADADRVSRVYDSASKLSSEPSNLKIRFAATSVLMATDEKSFCDASLLLFHCHMNSHLAAGKEDVANVPSEIVDLQRLLGRNNNTRALASLKLDKHTSERHSQGSYRSGAPWQLAETLWISRSRGYASFMQPEYITECAVQQEADTAYGVARFTAKGFYSGRVSYVARRFKGEWRVEELRMPNLGVSLQRSADGNWRPLIEVISGESAQPAGQEVSNDEN